MSDSNQQNFDSSSQAVPFFARYLEGQAFEDLSEEEIDGIRGGMKIEFADFNKALMDLDQPDKDFPMWVTHKYPSDGDDSVSDFPPEFFQ